LANLATEQGGGMLAKTTAKKKVDI